MPYIEPERRRPLLDVGYEVIDTLGQMWEQTNRHPGDVTYLFSLILWELFHQNYTDMNTALGILEAVKLEYYRRIVAPYEQGKMEVNGDV